MKALSLHGPWAYYERKAADNECRIADLESEVRQWKLQHDGLQQRLEQTESQNQQLQDVQLPELLSEKARSQSIIDNLQAELARERLERADEHRQLTMEVSSLTQELQKISADNAVLRSELAKTVHQKQLTSSKLEQIRKKLGLSESEAKAFIQELDDARAASKALREENKELAADNSHLKQQVESRSQHCMTLIGENKRLLEQAGPGGGGGNGAAGMCGIGIGGECKGARAALGDGTVGLLESAFPTTRNDLLGYVADLRMQLQKQQGELWQAKTEQQTAVAAARQLQQQQASGRKPPQVVVREWSQPSEPAGTTTGSAVAGAGPRSGLAASASTGSVAMSTVGSVAAASGARRAGGKQNRPPWSDGGSSKGASVASASASSKSLVHVPVGTTPLGHTDAAKAGVVRQALAVRQQRLVSAQKDS
ncbi:hypothetical protein PLESTB_000269800 [Pleodorina starrii]|uniref:Uncharacterized protein n=1 Tax=Pleodorina starrii TaxID=330485 RepID=A0A9W6EYV5_9CHLO|nr:hypothetical protein PLESTB_000269800 [Pleodorina starrii]